MSDQENRVEVADEDGYRLIALKYTSVFLMNDKEDLFSCSVVDPKGREIFHTGNANIDDLDQATLLGFLASTRKLLGLLRQRDLMKESTSDLKRSTTFVQIGEPYTHKGDMLRWKCDICGGFSWSFVRRIYWPQYCSKCGRPIGCFKQDNEEAF